MLYLNKRNNEEVVKLVSMDEKTSTCLMEYTQGEKVGKTFSITSSTLKRWWKKLDGDSQEGTIIQDASEVDTTNTETEEVIQQEQTDEVAVDTDIKEDAAPKNVKPAKKEKKQKADRSKRVDKTPERDAITQLLTQSGYKCKYYENVNCIKVQTSEGKTIAEVYVRSKYIMVRVKVLNEAAKKFECREGYKYYLPSQININYTETAINDVLAVIA